jgi:hypothetical protein
MGHCGFAPFGSEVRTLAKDLVIEIAGGFHGQLGTQRAWGSRVGFKLLLKAARP